MSKYESVRLPWLGVKSLADTDFMIEIEAQMMI